MPEFREIPLTMSTLILILIPESGSMQLAWTTDFKGLDSLSSSMWWLRWFDGCGLTWRLQTWLGCWGMTDPRSTAAASTAQCRGLFTWMSKETPLTSLR